MSRHLVVTEDETEVESTIYDPGEGGISEIVAEIQTDWLRNSDERKYLIYELQEGKYVLVAELRAALYTSFTLNLLG